MKESNKLKNELQSFLTIWKDGYFEGDVQDEIAFSSYGRSGFMSILYATYIKCIKPYINEDTVALEIGPGRGAWTKTMLHAKDVVVMDALSAEHNLFWEHIGNQSNVKYIQVSDFSCNELQDNYFTYMFSFGCLCHVSFDGISEYAKNLYPKLKSGSNCFWMIADYDNYNKLIERENELDLVLKSLKKKKILFPILMAYKLFLFFKSKRVSLDKNEANDPRPGRFYHAGIERCCEMLKSVGYKIIEKDTSTNHRDPIIHFRKE
jgi:hypothetical protein